MLEEMQVPTSGGSVDVGGTLNSATLYVSHPSKNGTTLNFTVSVNGSTVATKTTTTASPYGRVFDESLEFTLGGKDIIWRPYSTNATNPTSYYNEISVNGITIMVFEVKVGALLDYAFDVSYEILV